MAKISTVAAAAISAAVAADIAAAAEAPAAAPPPAPADAPAGDPAPATARYVVTQVTLRHDGAVYEPGSFVMLTDAQAERLGALVALAPAA